MSVANKGGKWKRAILFTVPKLLTKQLRELEEDGMVGQTAYAVVPPRLEYSLTDEGLTLAPLLQSLNTWGRKWLATTA